ncbi:MAG: hypothetical protein OEZ15_02695 [Gammaproteobacteria bacterium]|nr:hypothetical protein [Gammaproteobacteria bacterium]
MPYYIYKITTQPGMALVKNLELLDQYESFKEAKKVAREVREKQDGAEGVTVKVMFADNQLMAEEQLLEHREKPVIMEHEK